VSTYRLATLWTLLLLAWGSLWAVHSPEPQTGAAAWAVTSTVCVLLIACLHWAAAFASMPFGDTETT